MFGDVRRNNAVEDSVNLSYISNIMITTTTTAAAAITSNTIVIIIIAISVLAVTDFMPR